MRKNHSHSYLRDSKELFAKHDQPNAREFKLISDLCSRELNSEFIVQFDNEIDWEKFTELILKHRVNFLTPQKIAQAEIELPQSSSSKLMHWNEKAKLQMLTLTAEILRVSNVMKANAISTLFLKGPIAAKQIYGDFTAKNSRDIDVLINDNDIEECLKILIDDGYQLVYPYQKLNRAQKCYFNKVNNQLALFHPIKKIRLEIHWRLFANPYLLPYNFQNIFNNRHILKVGDKQISGLGKKHLLIYLCVHGAKHAWSKLYWLMEVAVLIKNEEELEATINEANAIGAERAVYLAIRLSQVIFNIELTAEVFPKNEVVINYLVDYVLNNMNQQKKQSIKTFLKDLNYKASLRLDLRYKLANRNFLSINDFTLFSLPSYLFFLYYPLRPFLYAWRQLSK